MSKETIESLYKKYCSVEARDETYLEEYTKMMQTIFDHDKSIRFVKIKRWTPSWNDGDPCYPYHAFGICSSEGMYDYDDCLYLYDEEYYNTNEEPILINAVSGVTFDEPISSSALNKTYNDSKIINIIENSNLETAIWDTNFEVLIRRGPDGNVVIQKESFDCGY